MPNSDAFYSQKRALQFNNGKWFRGGNNKSNCFKDMKPTFIFREFTN